MTLSETDRQNIRLIVEQQLEAFQRDDAAGAFALASPGIQAQFSTPEKFVAMVKSAYSAVYRPRAVIFEQVAIVDGTPSQKLFLLSPNGHLVSAHYPMEKQPSGTWRIQGCFLNPIEGKTV